MASHETLGLLLVRDGAITRPQLYDALRLQRQNGRLLGTCLLTLGYVEPQVLLDFLSRQLAIPALPPGALGRASPAALQKVPDQVAVRLRVLPYSWDGEILGVAVADGRALNHLHEVAFHSQSAVGAYVALEMEIEVVLKAVYPNAALVAAADTGPAVAPIQLIGRPRPARAEPAREVPTRDFGAALGIEEGEGASLPSPPLVIAGAPPRAPLRGPPPPARPMTPSTGGRPTAEDLALEHVGFYDAVEQIYQVESVPEIGRCVGRALLSYFSRVVIVAHEDRRLTVVGFGGVAAPPQHVGLEALPVTVAALEQRSIAYGDANTDRRSAELRKAFHLTNAPTSLIAPLSDGRAVRLLVYADNGQVEELYEDLHDVELLLKEAETALRILQGTS